MLVSWGGGALVLRQLQQHHGFCTPGTGWRSEDIVKAQQAHWLALLLTKWVTDGWVGRRVDEVGWVNEEWLRAGL